MSEIYLVVSDIHLGGHDDYEPNREEFSGFLEFVKDLPPEGRTISLKNGGERTILMKPPAKLILLGDVIELWDPREQDRNNIIKDSTKPFSILHEMDCDKIYVTGNHDEDVEKIAKDIGSFEWKDKNRFCIFSRHYPAKSCIEINGLKYSFLHGHQYDREQITYTLSHILNMRFDPVDFLQDMANVSFTKKLSIYNSLGLFLLWSALILLNFIFPSFINTAGIIFGVAGVIALVHYYRSSREVVRKRNVSGWFSYFFLIILAVLVWFLLSGEFYSFLFYFAVLIITYIVLVSVIPKIITFSMREFYNRFRRAKNKTAKEVVEENYFNLKKDTTEANVVVFGHTHQASTYLPETGQTKKPKFFINTGCWVKEKDNRDVNTFVYIDPEGVSLLKWVDGNIECISDFTGQDIMISLKEI